MEINPDHLPEDTAALQQMVTSLLEELEVRERRLRQLQHLVEQLLRYRYGPKRERVSENQLFLFAATLLSAGEENAPATKKSETSPPPRAGHGRQRLPRPLERRRVVYDLGEGDRRCPQCQEELKPIGEEVSERLEYVPASLYVIQ